MPKTSAPLAVVAPASTDPAATTECISRITPLLSVLKLATGLATCCANGTATCPQFCPPNPGHDQYAPVCVLAVHASPQSCANSPTPRIPYAPNRSPRKPCLPRRRIHSRPSPLAG